MDSLLDISGLKASRLKAAAFLSPDLELPCLLTIPCTPPLRLIKAAYRKVQGMRARLAGCPASQQGGQGCYI